MFKVAVLPGEVVLNGIQGGDMREVQLGADLAERLHETALLDPAQHTVRFTQPGVRRLLLVVGASLNQMTTLSWDPRLSPAGCLIHINIDPSEIGKNYSTQIPLVGDGILETGDQCPSCFPIAKAKRSKGSQR